MIRMILAISIVLCLSCTHAMAPGPIQRLSEGGGGGSCPYEGGLNELAIAIHWDELYGWVIPPMDSNARFWGDSATVLLNQLKHAESTMTCVPALYFELETAYTDTLTDPPHQGGFGNQYTILINFGGDYAPTAAERDSVVRVCNRAIWKMGIIANDVRNRAHWYGMNPYDFYFSGGF